MKKRLLAVLLCLAMLLPFAPLRTSAATSLPSNAVKTYLQLGDYVTVIPAQDASGKRIQYTNYALSGQSGGNFSGADVQMWKFGTSVKWCVRRVQNGAFALVTSNFEETQSVDDTSGIYFWDIEGKSVSEGANIHVWQDSDLNDDSKLFYLVEDNDGDAETFYIASYYTLTKGKTFYLAPKDVFNGTSWESDGRNIVLSAKAFSWRIQIISRESGNALPTDVTWMDSIPDCTRLSMVNIPGVHDAAATNTGDVSIGDVSIARCQKYFLDELLLAGIRALDIRLGYKDSQVVLNHSIVTCYHKDHGTNEDKPITLKNALDIASAFLKKYPSETIIFLIKKDDGDATVTDKALSILNGYKSILYDWSSGSPTLGDVRGKIVMMSRLEPTTYPSYLGPDLRNWDANYDDSLHFAQKISTTSSVAKVWVQDDYSSSYDNKKLQFLNTAKQLNGKLGTTDGTTPPVIDKKDFVFNYSSLATSIHVTTPLEASHTMNTYLLETLRQQGYWNVGTRMGIVMMDFADKMMAQVVINSNKTYSSTGHSYTAVKTLPDCTNEGHTTYTCKICGYTYVSDIVSANGHSYSYTNNGENHTVGCANCDYSETEEHTYVDGTCICGAVEVTEPKYNENLTLSMAVSVGAEMQVTYTVYNARVKSYESFYVEVVKEVADGESVTTVYSLDANNLAALNNPITGALLGYNAIYTGINASMMGDNFTATLYAVTANGTIEYGPSTTSSIKTYLTDLLEDSATIAELKTLAVDMLNYGAAAQSFFGYDVENPVNADLTEEQKALGTQEIPAAADTSSITGTDGAIMTDVSLQSKVMLYLTFVYSAKEDSNLTVVIKDSEGKVLEELVPTKAAAIAWQTIYSNVGAKQMRESITIELHDNGTCVSKTLTWNIESYVAQTRAKTDASAELINAVNAMLIYGDSAAAYMTVTGQ